MDIPKRYSPKDAEPKWLAYWEEHKLHHYDPKSTKPTFSVDTPPPYVSAAHLHVGHAMSYTQAEIIVRYKRMQGFNIFYPMGFDDNGLPTERFVEQTYKVNKAKISRADFIKLCLNETKKGGETYMKLWQSLGLSVDWRQLYSTINPLCTAVSQRSFIDLYKKGRMVRRNEPILWCTTAQTALAQADVETIEKETFLNHIAFTAADTGEELIIATTRPELIPACVAMYVNPEDARYKHLVGKDVLVPVSGQRVKVRTDESVAIDYGTGLMMVCTWGDAEDVRKWKEHDLPSRVILNRDGTLNALAGEFAGMNLEDARKAIIERLKTEGRLRKQDKLSHQVGIHERTGTPVEFLQTPQWFIKVIDLKDELLRRGDELTWYPPHFKTQYQQWVDGLKWDWCISRQRFYGVPFPLWYCAGCGEVKLAESTQLPVDPTAVAPIGNCSKCGSSSFEPEHDVMDTWMTSSLSPLINSHWGEPDERLDAIYPLTVRVQAFEIIRTWLFYTVVKSHLHTNSLPFKHAMISGWGLDAGGKKMSKRTGNFVTPESVIEKYSADALRYWTAGAHLGANLNWSESEVANGNKLLTKLWNASKFIAMQVADFTDAVDPMSPPAYISSFDRGMLSKLSATIDYATKSLDAYEFAKAKTAIERFFWVDLCDNYLEIVKEIVYQADKYGDERRRSAQWTLKCLLDCTIKLFAPYLPFITEELFHIYLKKEDTPLSLHISDWPKPILTDATGEGGFDAVVAVIQVVRRFKTENNVALNTPVDVAIGVVQDGGETGATTMAQLQGLEAELQSATRASSIAWNATTGTACEGVRLVVNVSLPVATI